MSQNGATVQVPPTQFKGSESYEFLIPIVLWGLIILGWLALPSLKQRRIRRRNRGQRHEVGLALIEAILRIINQAGLWPFKQ